VEVREIRIADIVVSESNTRKDLEAGGEDAGLDELANSIRDRGLLSPITVMKRTDGKYDLVAGQRRFLACSRVGMQTIPSIIRDRLDDTDATIISLIENVHRADMNPIDKARAYQKIYQKYQDYEVVSKQTGVTTQTIKKYLALLRLAPTIQEKMTTTEGPGGILAMSRLAETFESSKAQEDALRQIGGFKQSIQVEILKRSEGDLNKLSELRAAAMEGAFDVRSCSEGLCFEMPEELKAEVKRIIREKGDFTHLIRGLNKGQ
jgi:ParB family chromosome partitioning protein